MQPATRRYAAFISYRHVEPDKSVAEWLHRRLEAYRLPRALVRQGCARRLGRIFRDQDELSASGDLRGTIRDALEESDSLVVVCSPRTPASAWVDREIMLFRDLGRYERIWPLLIEGDTQQAIPTSLRGSVDAASGAINILAVDVRAPTPRRRRQLLRREMLRLVAAMLGCRYDDLRQREAERTRRRLATVAAVLTCLTVVFAGLAWYALDRGLEAEAQRREAVAQRDLAELERTRAEAAAAVALAETAQRQLADGEVDAALRTGLRVIDDYNAALSAEGRGAMLDLLRRALYQRPRPTESILLSSGLDAFTTNFSVGGTYVAAFESLFFDQHSTRLVVWDSATGTPRLTFDGDQIYDLAFYDDRVVLFDQQEDLRIFDLRDGTLRVARPLPPRSGDLLFFSHPDSPIALLLDDGDSTITLLSLLDGATLATFAPPGGSPVARLDYRADGGALALIYRDGSVFEAAAPDWQPRSLATAPILAEATLMEFTPDGAALLLATEADVVAVLDRRSGALRWWQSPDEVVGLTSLDDEHLVIATGSRLQVLQTAAIEDGPRVDRRLGIHNAVLHRLTMGTVMAGDVDGGLLELWSPLRDTEPTLKLGQDGEPVVFATDATRGLLALATGSGNVLLYRAGDGEEIGRWREHPGAVVALEFGEGLLLSAGADGRLRRYAPHSAAITTLARLPGSGVKPGSQAAPQPRLAMSPDGAVVAIRRDDGGLALWKGAATAPLSLNVDAPLDGLALSPGGGYLLSTSQTDWTLRIWRTDNGQELLAARALQPLPPLDSLAMMSDDLRWQVLMARFAVSPDDRYLLAADADFTSGLFALPGLERLDLADLVDPLDQSEALVGRLAAAAGMTLVFAEGYRAWIDAQGAIRRAPYPTDATLKTALPGEPVRLALDRAGRLLLLSDEATAPVEGPMLPAGGRARMAFAAMGERFALDSFATGQPFADGVEILDTRQARRLALIRAASPSDGLEGWILSPDGSRLLTLEALGGGAVLWDVDSARRIVGINPPSFLHGATFTPDSRRMLVVSELSNPDEGGVWLFDARSGERLYDDLRFFADPTGVAFSSDGGHLIDFDRDPYLSDNHAAVLVNSSRGARVLDLTRALGRVADATFTAAGDALIVLLADGTLVRIALFRDDTEVIDAVRRRLAGHPG